jgi:hypothetical protein
LCTAEYWEEGDYGDERPPIDLFADRIAQIESRFFTIDLARKRNGEWIVMELGDAQVAGLPERLRADDFYRALAAHARIT